MSSDTSGVNIPSSTIVAIGGGFVCGAFLLLSSFVFFRIIKLAREARRRRRQGEDVTFRQLWRAAGGFWGFFMGTAAQGTGPRGHAEMLARMRLEIELYNSAVANARLDKEPDKPLPKLYETALTKAEEVLFVDDCVPLAVAPTLPPDQAEIGFEEHYRLLDPELDLSVLILYPIPTKSRDSYLRHSNYPQPDMDELDDLPEMVVGTTTLIPFITPGSGDEPVKEVEAESADEQSLTNVLPKLYKGVSEDGNIRRAGWTRDEEHHWRIEGL